MSQPLQILIVNEVEKWDIPWQLSYPRPGHMVEGAMYGLQAFNMLSMQAFDCVMPEVQMLGMDGVEFYRQLPISQPGLPVVLKSIQSLHSSLPVLLMTGYRQKYGKNHPSCEAVQCLYMFV